MKYWVYLNDEVSQKPYTEEELQQLNGFGPDVLICSEASAVSKEPDWRQVKDLLPHLIRPKAPNFSKFRPTPPVITPKEEVKEEVPAPAQNIQSDEADYSKTEFNANLLTQLQSLTAKIASLETKIDEQEHEEALAHNLHSEEKEKEPVEEPIKEPVAEELELEEPEQETLVSDPQNEQDDDVLEVPFDNDFEVPFDVNKSSEEIANEAEAILSKPLNTEIEEYDAEDQATEFINYESEDMQKILEDTVREANRPKVEVKKEPKKEKRTYIAEDLISKTTFKFNVNTTVDDKEKNKENKDESKEGNTVEETQNEVTAEVQTPANHQEDDAQNNNIQENNENTAEPVAVKQEEVKQEEAKQEPVNTAEHKTQIKSLDDLLNTPSHSNNVKQEEQEETKPQLTALNEAHLKDVEVKHEAIEEEQPTPQLSSLNQVPDNPNKGAAQTEEQEVQPKVQLASLGDISINSDRKPVQHEEPVQVKSQLASLDDLYKKDEHNKDNSSKEVKTNNLDDLVTENIDDIKTDGTSQNSGESKDNLESLTGSNQEADSNVNKVDIPDNYDDMQERTANLSMTQNVTISDDETTAAVLNEIAQEKAQDTNEITMTEKLFEELEEASKSRTENKEIIDESSLSEDDNTQEAKQDAAPAEVPQNVDDSPKSDNSNLEINLNEEFANEDEFLKTFTTSVEEVFLDQPTAIISDYVPPTDSVEHTTPVAAETNVKRAKPSDIKTVPLVPEVMGQEIHSSPYVDSGTAKLGKASMLSNWIKWIFVILLIAIMLAGALSALAVMGIIPEKLSPIHTVIYSLQKTPQVSNNEDDSDLAPEMIDQNQGNEQDISTEQNQTYDIAEKVKNYRFSDGTILQDRIKNTHSNLTGDFEWSVFPTEEQNIYSIAVKIPQNQDGQGFSYRFNYNISDNSLTPTTSEAKNIIENYSR